jgi:uncharacterized protein YbbK (DUF523 family)
VGIMKIVSACLVGINCNYKSENKLNPKIYEDFEKGGLFPVCPEVFGGQPIPRPPAEIRNGTGLDVLEGKAKVINPDGSNVTSYFVKGAFEVLKIAKTIGAKEAILKARSPSCGCGKTYDGTFSGILIKGDGVTTALLKKNGIKVYTEENFR